MSDSVSRLLAVADDVTLAELIVEIAETYGYEGFITSDSLGVVNLTNALKPVIVAIDVCMLNIEINELFGGLMAAGYKGEVLIIGNQKDDGLRETQRMAEGLGLNVRAILKNPLEPGLLQKILAPEQSAT